MSLHAVIREAGPAWDETRDVTGQPGVSDHSTFMQALSDAGFLLFGGQLGDEGRFRALLIVDAGGEAEIHGRLAEDPWELSRQIVTLSAEPWTVLVGAERLDRS
jgi:hypothetical protein